ncbi:MAG: helix-turn-helix domain-containing protein [Gammaproteobacteria bacterium]|nr:helix-turn-helix domain-containing protein [Gammaproteobacteria bacterium]
MDTVHTWQHRIEDGQDLKGFKRSGRPPLYDDTFHARIIAFFCQMAPLPGCTRWTLRWAHNYITHQPMTLGSPSRSTLARILHSHHLRPHRLAYFLHIADPTSSPKWSTSLSSIAIRPSTFSFSTS